jgi:hypothetical protein
MHNIGVGFSQGSLMLFIKIWCDLQSKLYPGLPIKNWTAAKGYLGDEFTITHVLSTHVAVAVPGIRNILRVAKKDFEIMFDNWVPYCSGKLRRKDIAGMTRVSKYTMSILRHLDIELP